jgi:hypothetical protein
VDMQLDVLCEYCQLMKVLSNWNIRPWNNELTKKQK